MKNDFIAIRAKQKAHDLLNEYYKLVGGKKHLLIERALQEAIERQKMEGKRNDAAA